MQGYFGAADDGHEPQRLTQQLHPEKLRITREAAMPAAKKEDIACRIISGLNPAEAETLKAAAEAGGAEAKIMPLAEPVLHLVLIADLASKGAADKKAAELTRLGIGGYRAVELDGGRHEIILASFQTEPAARAFLQGLAKRGIKSARAEVREQPVVKARIEARGPASALLRQLSQLIAPYADATTGDCGA